MKHLQKIGSKEIIAFAVLVLCLSLSYHFVIYIPSRDAQKAIKTEQAQKYDIDTECSFDDYSDLEYPNEGMIAALCMRTVDIETSRTLTDEELGERVGLFFMLRCKMETYARVLNTRLCTTFDNKTVKITLTD